MAELWRNADAETKAKYTKKAKLDRERWQAESSGSLQSTAMDWDAMSMEEQEVFIAQN